MGKIKHLTLAMESMIDHYTEVRKNKIMIIDAITGQGKTSAAIELMERYAKNQIALPPEIERIKFFYFSPLKNNWPTERIFKSNQLREKSAFLFSQQDTFGHLTHQYENKGRKENNPLFIKLLALADPLRGKQSSSTKEAVRLYDQAVNKFFDALIKKKRAETIQSAYHQLNRSVKHIIRLCYPKNRWLLREELAKNPHSPWQVLQELFPSIALYDERYDFYFATVDKMLLPFETILHGRMDFSKLRDLFGKKTLLMVFVDEWDQAFERFAAHHYKKHAQIKEDPFDLVRQLVLAPIRQLPAYHEDLSQKLASLVSEFMTIHPYAAYTKATGDPFQAILYDDLEIATTSHWLAFHSPQKQNILQTNGSGAPLAPLLRDYLLFAKKFFGEIKRAGEETKEQGGWQMILKYLLLEETPFVQNLMQSSLKADPDSDILFLESDGSESTATIVPTPVEARLRGVLFEDPKRSPTLLIGMSATANFLTPINNFSHHYIERIAPDIFYEIPQRIQNIMKEEYRKTNNYSLKNQEVEEIVIPIGRAIQGAQTKAEALNKILNKNDVLTQHLVKIAGANQADLILKEYKEAVKKVPLHTLKDILVVNEVLKDAKEKGIKNMFLFSTNAYQKPEEKVVLLYTHIFLLLEQGKINTVKEMVQAQTKELFFLTAESFREERGEPLQEAIQTWDHCYIITSYMSAARGVNLLYTLKKEDVKGKSIRKINPRENNPEPGDAVDIQAVYLQKPTYVIPQIPSQKGFGSIEMIEVVDNLLRLYESNSITRKELTDWIQVELSLVSHKEVLSPYPAQSTNAKIAAIKLAMQAIGRRTRTSYRYRKCYTYIDQDFFTEYPWEKARDFNTLSESQQLTAIIQAKALAD